MLRYNLNVIPAKADFLTGQFILHQYCQNQYVPQQGVEIISDNFHPLLGRRFSLTQPNGFRFT